MKNVILFYLLLSFYSLPNAFGQAKIKEGSISKETILDDLNDYKRGIDRNHIDPYTLIKRKDFFNSIEQIKQSANEYDLDELFVKWFQLNARIGDPHTWIQIRTRDIFPFITHWYEEGIYIIATNDENRRYYHAKIIAINDVPIDEVVRRMYTIVPDTSSMPVKQRIPDLIIDPVILHGLHISSERNKVTYTVLTQANETVKVTATPIDIRDKNQLTGLKPEKFLRTAIRGKYWFKYLDSINAIYFNYGTCTDDGTFQHVIDKLEKTIEQKGPKKIVIDMRYNGGGESRLLEPLIDYLAKSTLNKSGGIYVLIGRKTFSSAVLNAATLKMHTKAIFAGEETGGRIEHFGDVKYFTLPETGLRVYYSTKYFKSNIDNKGQIVPDKKITEKFAEYDNNIDSVLDYALAQ